ncbi:hypothetical protein HYV86_00540 [Candidatus Woesearchaeota archaeon]|nr:hypothetical protein [Candidatus Woesearchaeota archaeon]
MNYSLSLSLLVPVLFYPSGHSVGQEPKQIVLETPNPRSPHSISLTLDSSLFINSHESIVSTTTSLSELVGSVADMVAPTTALGRVGEISAIAFADGVFSCFGHEFGHQLYFKRTGSIDQAPFGICFTFEEEAPYPLSDKILTIMRMHAGAGSNIQYEISRQVFEQSLQTGDVHDAVTYLINRLSPGIYSYANLLAGTSHLSHPSQIGDIQEQQWWDLEVYTAMVNLSSNNPSNASNYLNSPLPNLRLTSRIHPHEIAFAQAMSDVLNIETYHASAIIGEYVRSGKREYQPLQFQLGPMDITPPQLWIGLSGSGPIAFEEMWFEIQSMRFNTTYGTTRIFSTGKEFPYDYFKLGMGYHADVQMGIENGITIRDGTITGSKVGGFMEINLGSWNVGARCQYSYHDLVEQQIWNREGLELSIILGREL